MSEQLTTPIAVGELVIDPERLMPPVERTGPVYMGGDAVLPEWARSDTFDYQDKERALTERRIDALRADRTFWKIFKWTRMGALRVALVGAIGLGGIAAGLDKGNIIDIPGPLSIPEISDLNPDAATQPSAPDATPGVMQIPRMNAAPAQQAPPPPPLPVLNIAPAEAIPPAGVARLQELFGNPGTGTGWDGELPFGQGGGSAEPENPAEPTEPEVTPTQPPVEDTPPPPVEDPDETTTPVDSPTPEETTPVPVPPAAPTNPEETTPPQQQG